ncbi:hypothetical protein PoB_006434200 [Plakobranchus ocellatus]|uniref:Uncharacterized protein n=1 Tax=Plakobranchus ocellatus TaxID=259542 RepID=A0AAV4D0V2_9GAST|nr:hypothetical protein PoB_006434200 [Plakobranchus ocellatus]
MYAKVQRTQQEHKRLIYCSTMARHGTLHQEAKQKLGPDFLTDSDDLPLVEIQRKSYVRRKTRRKVFTTSCASSSDQSDWNSYKDPDYVPLDDQPSGDDSMPTEKMRTPQKNTQPQPITPSKYMQVSVDAMQSQRAISTCITTC